MVNLVFETHRAACSSVPHVFADGKLKVMAVTQDWGRGGGTKEWDDFTLLCPCSLRYLLWVWFCFLFLKNWCETHIKWIFFNVILLTGASQVAQWYRIPLSMQERQVRSLGWEDPPEKEMTTHCSILTWEILWTEEPGGLESVGS